MIPKLIDAALEVPIISSFTRIGYDVRSRTDSWADLDSYDLSGRVVVVTGATSGIGLAAAHWFAKMGATLVITGRRTEKNRAAVDEVVQRSGNERVSEVAADMGELDQVATLAEQVLLRHDRLDVLVHNAGALTNPRRTTSAGTEVTVASQVVGPFLLTQLLLDRLKVTKEARVLTMSSGGMYGAGLTVRNLQMPEADYNGTKQYAIAKRAQVTLNEMWAEKFPDISFHALHPGWVDTPGVDDALPGFGKIVGPILRTPDQGADTLVWLGSDPTVTQSNGKFWHDRRQRSIHKLSSTRKSDTPDRRAALWEWVRAAAHADPQPG